MADAVSSSLSNDDISYQLMVTLYRRVVAVHAVDVLINRQSCSDCDWSKDAASPDGVVRLSCRLVLPLVRARRLTF